MRVRKRGDIWFARFWEGAARVERSTRCTDKKAAETVARQWELDAADPDHATTRRATLNDALALLLAWLLGAIAVVAFLYLTVVNLLLRSWLRQGALYTDTASVRASSAYTLLPGRLHVDGLRVRARGWSLFVERADIRFDATALASRRLHVTRLRGAGLDVVSGPSRRARAVPASSATGGASVLLQAIFP